MTSLSLTTLSPVAAYLDEIPTCKLALRPGTLEGKVVGLLPNWRPAAVHILKAVGALLEERHGVKAVVLEKPVVGPPRGKGKIIDVVRDLLDDLAQRVDVVITGSGD